MGMGTFPLDWAKSILIELVRDRLCKKESLPADAAEKIIDLHLDPANFPMHISVDAGIWRGLRAGLPVTNLSKFIAFEDTRSIRGICRVMARTHLNRQGVSEVSGGGGDRTLSPRVLGLFEGNFDPIPLTDWNGLLDRWMELARRPSMTGAASLFNDDAIESLRLLAKCGPDQPKEFYVERGVRDNWAKVVPGVYTGLRWLKDRYAMDAAVIWKRIDKASQSAEGISALMAEARAEVAEYGAALSGSFFADLGAGGFVKADVHVKDAIGAYRGDGYSNISDAMAFKVLTDTAERHRVTPRAVDKLTVSWRQRELLSAGLETAQKRAADLEKDISRCAELSE
jgi:hypothetical protein